MNLGHPDLTGASIRVIRKPVSIPQSCRNPRSEACRHGTFIAGLMAANPGSPTPGLAPQCPLLLHPIFCEADAVTACPRVTIHQLAAAVRAMTAERPRLINLSIGVVGDLQAGLHELWTAFDEARDGGILLVAAAGNERPGIVAPFLQHPWVIAVGALEDAAGPSGPRINDRADTPLFLTAPGRSVPGLDARGGYCALSGTSVAAGLVSGAIAALLSRRPDASAMALRHCLQSLKGNSSTLEPVRFRADLVLAELERLMSTNSSTQSPTDAAARSESCPSLDLAGPTSSSDRPRHAGSQDVATQGVIPQACSCGGDAGTTRPIYAVGLAKPVFPSVGLQKELEYAAGRIGVADTNIYGVLSYTDANQRKPYTYIAQALCWVLEIGGVDTYVLSPRSGVELQDLIASLAPPTTGPADETLTLAVGSEGPPARPSRCAGLALPVVTCNQVYYFTMNGLMAQLKQPGVEAQALREMMLGMQIKPNPGSAPGQRALNYVAFRYPEIYRKATELAQPSSPTSADSFHVRRIQTRPSSLAADREIIDVIFEFENPSNADQEFYYVSVDVTGQFPYLNTPWRAFVPEN